MCRYGAQVTEQMTRITEGLCGPTASGGGLQFGSRFPSSIWLSSIDFSSNGEYVATGEFYNSRPIYRRSFTADPSSGYTLGLPKLRLHTEWDSAACTWTLYPTVTATSILVYDTIFPLRMGPSASSTASADFDTFVERVFEPFLVEAVEIQSSVPSVPAASESPAPSGAGEDEFTVESIKKKRVKLGHVRYLVKWAECNNRFNR